MRALEHIEFSNHLADVLRANPTLFDELKNKRTNLGVTLWDCLKVGFEIKGLRKFGFAKSA